MASPTEMVHPDDATLLAMIHGEAPHSAAALQAHLGTCADCTSRMDQLLREDSAIAAQLRLLDHPVPATAPMPPRRHRRAGRFRRVVLATASAAAVTAAMLAALPASPLHRWLTRLGKGTPSVALGSTDAASTLTSGIAVAPSPIMLVRFVREHATGVVEISRTTSPLLTFRSRGGVTAYTVTDAQVAIDNQVAAETYLIEVPTMVRELKVLVDGRLAAQWPADSARLSDPSDSSRFRVDLRVRQGRVP
ncbi:MAG: hypothetical protein ABJC19_09900 [Gemmatimonadota bacterium]